MKKFEVTSLRDLSMGDRFYYLSDKKKTVHEIEKVDDMIPGKKFVRLVGTRQVIQKRPNKFGVTARVVFLNSLNERNRKELDQ